LCAFESEFANSIKYALASILKYDWRCRAIMQRPDADLFGGDPEQGGVLLSITIYLAIAIGCADSSGPLRIFGLEKTGTAQQLFNLYATGA
jgi:hypothetical protein